MKTRIVRIGNSRGIRIPKPFLEQARLRDDVELEVVNQRLVISSPDHPRTGWEAAFRAMAAAGDFAVPIPERAALDFDVVFSAPSFSFFLEGRDRAPRR